MIAIDLLPTVIDIDRPKFFVFFFVDDDQCPSPVRPQSTKTFPFHDRNISYSDIPGCPIMVFEELGHICERRIAYVTRGSDILHPIQLIIGNRIIGIFTAVFDFYLHIRDIIVIIHQCLPIQSGPDNFHIFAGRYRQLRCRRREIYTIVIVIGTKFVMCIRSCRIVQITPVSIRITYITALIGRSHKDRVADGQHLTA